MPCMQQSWKFLGEGFPPTVILHVSLEEVSEFPFGPILSVFAMDYA